MKLFNERENKDVWRLLCNAERAPIDLNCLSGKFTANHLIEYVFGIYIPSPDIKLYF